MLRFLAVLLLRRQFRRRVPSRAILFLVCFCHGFLFCCSFSALVRLFPRSKDTVVDGCPLCFAPLDRFQTPKRICCGGLFQFRTIHPGISGKMAPEWFSIQSMGSPPPDPAASLLGARPSGWRAFLVLRSFRRLFVRLFVSRRSGTRPGRPSWPCAGSCVSLRPDRPRQSHRWPLRPEPTISCSFVGVGPGVRWGAGCSQNPP